MINDAQKLTLNSFAFFNELYLEEFKLSVRAFEEKRYLEHLSRTLAMKQLYRRLKKEAELFNQLSKPHNEG